MRTDEPKIARKSAKQMIPKIQSKIATKINFLAGPGIGGWGSRGAGLSPNNLSKTTPEWFLNGSVEIFGVSNRVCTLGLEKSEIGP
jgi:hypothetical protein